jgi:quercetin dioxygenase-like cupin family protein
MVPFVDTKDLEVKEPLPGWKGRYFHSENMTFAYYDFTAGASIHEHSHSNEEAWHVIEGELEVTIGGETRVAGPGSVGLVPSDEPHSVRALSDGRAIVVDLGVRDSIQGVQLFD